MQTKLLVAILSLLVTAAVWPRVLARDTPGARHGDLGALLPALLLHAGQALPPGRLQQGAGGGGVGGGGAVLGPAGGHLHCGLHPEHQVTPPATSCPVVKLC